MAHHHHHLDDDAHGVGFEDLGLDHDEPAPRIHTPYEQVMGFTADHVPHEALAQRLGEFRKWLVEDANCIVNAYLSIVNGEAHDGTKNAPTWTVEKSSWETDTAGQPSAVADSSDRCGMIDLESDRDLYDRGMGCCVMATKEIKKEEVLMQIPRTAMITPDVVAASDAGRVALACCERQDEDGEGGSSSSFWDSFAGAGEMLEMNKEKFKTNRGEHLLIRILQERKKAETATKRHEGEIQQSGDQSGKSESDTIPYKLAAKGALSRKVPFQLFLIQQRFANDASPAIVSKLMQNGGDLKGVNSSIHLSDDAPSTFGPYARTLPSVIPLPVCWRRQELALLSGCVSGNDALQEVVARTVQLVSEYKAVLEAGILHRFPNIFPPGMITWERWMWADAVLTSRLLPTECYLNDGDKRADSMSEPVEEELMQSPAGVWDDLGVLIPLLDMLNHECDDAPITWEQNLTEKKTITKPDNGKQVTVNPHLPRARAHKRIRKHMQLYVSYGSNCNNYDLMIRYGFAVTRNRSDEVKIGWSVNCAVGGESVSAPKDYISPFKDDEEEDSGKAKEDDDSKKDGESKNDKDSTGGKTKQRPLAKDLVFEADDKSEAAKLWWTPERYALLEREMKELENDSFYAGLRTNKPMIILAYNNASYHPHLLLAAAIATMPAERVEHYSLADEKVSSKGMGLTKRHCKVLQRYLHFFFTNKIEKLLTGLSSLVSNHFDKIKLWTKMAHGGLNFVDPGTKGKDKSPIVDASGGMPMGWMEFVNTCGIPFSIETEKSKKYCALTPDACALFFYDGHLNALQTSIDGLVKDDKFEANVLRQLEGLGFTIMSEEDEANEVLRAKPKPPPEEKRKAEEISKTNGVSEEKGKEKPVEHKHKKKKNKKSRRGNHIANGSDRPPTIKLHIGNLSYQTQTSDLYEYFGNLYGRDNVLECHIPVERETGRSRGFGFVTLPEAVALSILKSERKHEIKGRLLKVAESNSAGSTNRGRVSAGQQPPNDRCARCGYRPKYCICATPDIPALSMNGRGLYHEEPPRYDMYHGDPYGRDPDYDYYHGGYRRERDKYNNSSHSPSRRRRDRDYDRDYRYDRSRSRSYSRDRGQDRDRERRRDRDRDRRGRSRSRERSRRRSYEHRSRSSRYNSRSRSEESDQSYPTDSRGRRDRDRDRGGDVAMEGRGKTTSPSRSASPPRRRRRSRSRSRDRDRRRRSSKKSRKRRSRSRSPATGQSRNEK